MTCCLYFIDAGDDRWPEDVGSQEGPDHAQTSVASTVETVQGKRDRQWLLLIEINKVQWQW